MGKKEIEYCEVPGWLSSHGNLARTTIRQWQGQPVTVWEKQAGQGLSLVELLEEDGEVVGVEADILFSDGRTKRRFIPVEVGTARNVSEALLEATGELWVSKEARAVTEWLADALKVADAPRHKVASKVRWVNGELVVPGINVELSPWLKQSWLSGVGPKSKVEQEAAKQVWRQVVEAAGKNPKLAIALGSAVASVYLERLGANSFLLHLTGDSTLGRRRVRSARWVSSATPTACSVVGTRRRTASWTDWRRRTSCRSCWMKRAGTTFATVTS